MNEEDEMETLTKLWAATAWPVGSMFKMTIDGRQAFGKVTGDAPEGDVTEAQVADLYSRTPDLRRVVLVTAEHPRGITRNIDVFHHAPARLSAADYEAGLEFMRSSVETSGVVEPIPPGEPRR